MARRPRGARTSSASRRRAVPAETAYQRRIRLYKERHPGATTQEARGKRAGEHIARKARESREDTTTYQRGKVREWVRRQAQRNGARPAAVAEMHAKMQERLIKNGYEAFRQMADWLRRQHAKKNKQSKVIVIAGRAANLAIMEQFAEFWDIDLEWLYYG
jgi:hypothetical protein